MVVILTPIVLMVVGIPGILFRFFGMRNSSHASGDCKAIRDSFINVSKFLILGMVITPLVRESLKWLYKPYSVHEFIP